MKMNLRKTSMIIGRLPYNHKKWILKNLRFMICTICRYSHADFLPVYSAIPGLIRSINVTGAYISICLECMKKSSHDHNYLIDISDISTDEIESLLILGELYET